jgi:hypothetical protein
MENLIGRKRERMDALDINYISESIYYDYDSDDMFNNSPVDLDAAPSAEYEYDELQLPAPICPSYDDDSDAVFHSLNNYNNL